MRVRVFALVAGMGLIAGISPGTPASGAVSAARLTQGTLGPFAVDIDLDDCMTECPRYVPELNTYVAGRVSISAPTAQPGGSLSDFDIVATLLRDGAEVEDGFEKGPLDGSIQLLPYKIGWTLCSPRGSTCSGRNDFTMRPTEPGKYQMVLSGIYMTARGTQSIETPATTTIDLFTILPDASATGDVTCIKMKGQAEDCVDGDSWTFDYCFDKARYQKLQKWVSGQWRTIKTNFAVKSYEYCPNESPWNVFVSRIESTYGTKKYRIVFPPQSGDGQYITSFLVTVS